jgi:hypothetical protein
MTGRPEQIRRAAAVIVAEKRARNTALLEVLALAKHNDLDLIVSFCQAQLGTTRPLEEVWQELSDETIH